jgi:hypothetical protein
VLARVPACGAARLALAGGNVYWTERATGAVKAVAAASSGATPTIVATGQMTPGAIAADDVAVYWSDEGDMTIRQAPLLGPTDGGVDGGGPTDGGGPADGGADGGAPFVSAPAVVKGLLASGGFLYYTSGPSALRIPRAGGASLTLASFAVCRMSQPVALALDSDYLYQTDVLNQYITRELNDGTQLVNNPCVAADAGAPQIAAPTTITHSQGELYLDALYRAGDEVVWADHTNIYAKLVATGTVSAREVANSAGANTITGFVVTGANVYLAEGVDVMVGATSNTIQVAPLGTPDSGDMPSGQVVAVGQIAASSLAADATHVYWTTHTPSITAGAPDDCQILSLSQ